MLVKQKRVWLITVVLVTTLSFITGCGKNDDSSLSPAASVSNSQIVTSVYSSEPDISETTILSDPAAPTVLATSPSTQTVTVNTPVHASTPGAEEIALNSVASIERLKSVKFDMDFSMSFDLSVGEQARTMKMRQTAVSQLDITNRKLMMNMDLVIDFPGQGEQAMNADMYSLDGWMYIGSIVSGYGTQWQKMKQTQEYWVNQIQIESTADFLKSAAGLDLSTSENVRGIDCYVISVTPDNQSLSGWMSGQMQNGTSGGAPGVESLAGVFDDFIVREWIAKDTFLPVKQQVSMRLLPEPGTSRESGMSMDATLVYYGYNEPIAIELPAEAVSAREIQLP